MFSSDRKSWTTGYLSSCYLLARLSLFLVCNSHHLDLPETSYLFSNITLIIPNPDYLCVSFSHLPILQPRKYSAKPLTLHTTCSIALA